MGRLYDAYVEVGPRFAGFGDIKKQGDAAGREYGKALAEAAAKAAAANVRKLGEALAKARSSEADAAGKVRVAEQKLDETRKQSGVKISQIIAAEEALAAAQRKSATAGDAAKAAAQSLEKARERAAKTAQASGQETGVKFGAGLKNALSKVKTDSEGEESGKRFGIGFSKQLPAIGGRVTSFFKTGLGTAAAIAGGAVLGGGLIAGFNEALGQGDIKAKFQAQLGLSDVDSAKAGKTAGDLYKAAYGDSLGQVNDAIRRVVQDTGTSLNSVDLKPITGKVLSLASTFDLDLGGTTRAVGQLMRNGLAKDATQALDIVTRGFQSGVDKSDDFLDTLNEYGTQFRKLGLSGATATGLLSQGLKAGARDADTVADALKEFSIRAIDGSKTTSAGFKALGLDADNMAARIAKGGKPASDGLQLVLDKLRAIKDPVKQSQVAVELFGTKAEDLGKSLFALDPKHAVDALGQVSGAADKLNKTVGSTPQATISGFFRTLKQGSIESLGGVIAAFASGEVKAKGFQGVLQTVAVKARAIFDKVKLGVEGFRSAFSGEGVTSDGFVGAMERIGVAARTAFDYFKTDVLPRLKEFAGFLSDKVLPPVQAFVEKVLLAKEFLLPFAGVILAVIAGLKAWAIAQGILNVVLAANPIGLVVVAIAALVGGLVWAYKNSETFRNILQGAFEGIQKAAQIFAPLVKAAIDIVIGVFSVWWNYYAKPILKAFWEALQFAWGRAQDFASIVAAAFNAIKEPARIAIKFVVDTFLGMVETVLTGASKAFGWVPDLGDKLKTAAGEFRTFRDNVNNALDGVKDQAVNIAIKYSSTGVNLTTPSSVGRRAAGGPGGPVDGPGTTTSDDAGIFRLSRKEWVIKAASSMKYGDKAMASVNAGTAAIIPGFAKGGSPGLAVNSNGDSSSLAKSVASSLASMATAVAKQLAATGGGLAGTMAFGRSQQGKPYVWGAAGPNGYDCSGFVSALINYAKGRNPFSRLGATGSMPWSEMAAGVGRFMVGWFKGNPGHTAATINNVNFESRGGRGVVVGPGARGAFDPLFNSRAHIKGFAKGGRPGRDGDAPFDLLNPRGKQFQSDLAAALGVKTFDTGLQAGKWAPGTLAYNGTGKGETVRTAEQEADLKRPVMLSARIFIGTREITDIVRVEIDEKNRQAANSFNL